MAYALHKYIEDLDMALNVMNLLVFSHLYAFTLETPTHMTWRVDSRWKEDDSYE